MTQKFEFTRGKVLFNKTIVGVYMRDANGTFHVHDARGKAGKYSSEGEMCWHFMSFTGWSSYVYTFPPVRYRNSTKIKDRGIRKRFALT